MASPLCQTPSLGSRLRDLINVYTLPRAALSSVVVVALSLAQGCSTPAPLGISENRDIYPIQEKCNDHVTSNCRIPLFSDPDAIAIRDPQKFPRRYLELWDPDVRRSECATGDSECLERLAALSSYFDPSGHPPLPNKIGVALEGGGNKSGPFTLGVLAGLQQLGYIDDVGAIASVSGGSYAASFLFNRILDLHPTSEPVALRSLREESEPWFKSCIPDYFLGGGREYFSAIVANPASPRPPFCGEGIKGTDSFKSDYKYQEQVWMHHDLLLLDNRTNNKTRDSSEVPVVENLAVLTIATAATIPFQFVARTMFRWPVNSAPSKLAYTLGIEREYGYSPEDWQRAQDASKPIWRNTIDRRRDRTLSVYAQNVPTEGLPLWIIVTTAPGYINGLAWAEPAARDPIRQQFEITPNGFGSGIYGYAMAHPDAPYDFSGPNPKGMPILDAVVASAAFLDDNETLISKEPGRLFAGAFQQFANVDWFSEIRNFNVKDESRTIERALPWPFYLHRTESESTTPYIHLQDGGNAENAGIFPLLRRGYRTIVYAHGTTDTDSQFPALCHLKNQLEFDGNYYIVSQDLENLVSALPISADDRAEMAASAGVKGHFLNYFDQLCSQQIDGSDLVAFDRNARRAPSDRVSAVAKIYCGRLGRYHDVATVAYPARADADPGYKPCKEFKSRFPWIGDSSVCDTCGGPGLPLTFPVRRTLFFQTSASPLRFHVCRGDALQAADAARARSNAYPIYEPLGTIIAVVPAVSWAEVDRQILNTQPWSEDIFGPWNSFCSAPVEVRQALKIGYCQGPNASVLTAEHLPQNARPGESGVPCTALAHVMEDTCTYIDRPDINFRRPVFPQNDLVGETLHTTYAAYASYFDLGRAQVKRALNDAQYPALPGEDDVASCAIPISPAP